MVQFVVSTVERSRVCGEQTVGRSTDCGEQTVGRSTVCGEQTVGRSTVSRWATRFPEGRVFCQFTTHVLYRY